jgi:peptide/nickel transport system ATP-binding protein/oligopeptide transport system ATP-binding protein
MIPLLKVDGLKKYFPIHRGVLRKIVGHIKAVDGVDLTIYPEQTVALVGESGSGKSTVGRLILKLIDPTEGRLEFEGKDIKKLNKNELESFRKHVQIVFQDPFASLNPRMTILENLGEPLKLHQIPNPKERVAMLLEQVGLSPDLMGRYPHAFSGGQQQRICIARALSLSPKLIVLDEAVSSLDVSVQAQVLNLLLDIKKKFGLSYLFISHDLSVVRYIAERVVVMKQGRVVEEQETQMLFKSPKNSYTKALLDAIPG